MSLIQFKHFSTSVVLQSVENNADKSEAGVIWNGCNLNRLHIFVVLKRTWKKTIMPFKEVFTLKSNLASFYSFRKCLRHLWGTKDYFSFTYAFSKFYTLVIEISVIKRKLKWIWHWSRTEILIKSRSHQMAKWKTANMTNRDLHKK